MCSPGCQEAPASDGASSDAEATLSFPVHGRLSRWGPARSQETLALGPSVPRTQWPHSGPGSGCVSTSRQPPRTVPAGEQEGSRLHKQAGPAGSVAPPRPRDQRRCPARCVCSVTCGQIRQPCCPGDLRVGLGGEGVLATAQQTWVRTVCETGIGEDRSPQTLPPLPPPSCP